MSFLSVVLRLIRVAAPSFLHAVFAALASGCGGNGVRGGGDSGGSPGEPSPSIAQIQGTSSASPYAGRRVVTRGVVTRVIEGGFFIQDPACDAADGASCGLFVVGSAPAAVAGRWVEVTGRVTEFDPGRDVAPGGPTLTELTSVRQVRALGPGPVIAPVVLAWPPASPEARSQLENMLVTLTGPFTVQQNFFLGRYGNVTLATGGRVMAPTELSAPGTAANAVADANRRRSLLLDEGWRTQDRDPVPWLSADRTLRLGDQAAELTGVLDAGLASPTAGPLLPRLRPTRAPPFVRVNARTAAPAAVGGVYRVASANLDNDFLTAADGGHCAPSGTPADCRGARSAAEFARQEAKLVEELAGLDADVVGLMEVENDGGATLRHLVGALNARLGTTAFAAVPDPDTGLGADAVRVALIYRPARLRLVGSSRSDPSAIHSRAPLAQVFESIDGEDTFGVVASHFKSKDCSGAGGADRDAGDGQGCWNARRVSQAKALQAFARTLDRGGLGDLILLGDFNACSQEDPIRVLVNAGWIDETTRWGRDAYSYVFDGAAGQLDHVFTRPSLSARITGAAPWHINADEPPVLDYTLSFRQPACARCAPDGYTVSPYRASDHDPLVAGFASIEPPTVLSRSSRNQAP